MNPQTRVPRCARGGGRIQRPYTASFLVLAAACGGHFDIGHDAADAGPPAPVYAGTAVGGTLREPPDGGGAPAAIATQQGWFDLIASDGTRTYWEFFDSNLNALDSDVLRSCDPSDCQ